MLGVIVVPVTFSLSISLSRSPWSGILVKLDSGVEYIHSCEYGGTIFVQVIKKNPLDSELREGAGQPRVHGQ